MKTKTQPLRDNPAPSAPAPYRCEVPNCSAPVRVICDKGHAYVPGAAQFRDPPMRMPFGRYKGDLIEDLPMDYIEWCLGNLDLRPALQNEMEAQIELRQGRGVPVKRGR